MFKAHSVNYMNSASKLYHGAELESMMFQRQSTVSVDNMVLHRLGAKAILKKLSEKTFGLATNIYK
jgi:hypothetical protein